MNIKYGNTGMNNLGTIIQKLTSEGFTCYIDEEKKGVIVNHNSNLVLTVQFREASNTIVVERLGNPTFDEFIYGRRVTANHMFKAIREWVRTNPVVYITGEAERVIFEEAELNA